MEVAEGGLDPEHLERQMDKSAFTVRGEGEFTGICLRKGDDVRDALKGSAWIDNKHNAILHQQSDRGKIFQRIIGQLFVRMRRDDQVPALPQRDRVTVRRGTSAHIETKLSSRPGAIVDHYGLAQPRSQFLPD